MRHAHQALLRVPLRLLLTDHGANLPGAAPEQSALLPPKAQLALTVLERREDAAWAPFLGSWPAPPLLPNALDPDLLSEAQDDAWAEGVARERQWLSELHRAACATTAAHAAEPPCSLDAFCASMRLVGSRVLRLRMGAHGKRRCLVPVLDLANHEPQPAALYRFSAAAPGGAAEEEEAIELVAARPLRAGDAVTIAYGEFGSAAYAQAYGFVPRANPHEAITLTLGRFVCRAGDT